MAAFRNQPVSETPVSETKNSLWYRVIHWLGVMWTQHLKVCSLPFTFNKIQLIVTSCFSQVTHSFCFPKTLLLLYSIIPHLPLTCSFLFYKNNGTQEGNSGTKTPTLALKLVDIIFIWLLGPTLLWYLQKTMTYLFEKNPVTYLKED